MYDEENKASIVFIPYKKGKIFHIQLNLAIPDLDNTDTSLSSVKCFEFKKKNTAKLKPITREHSLSRTDALDYGHLG